LNWKRAFGEHRFIYLAGVVLPLAVYAIFVGFPLLYNVFLSFTSWNGLSSTAPLVGFANYTRLAADPGFRSSFFNSLQWTAISLCIHLVFGVGLAIILYSGRVYFPTLFRSLIFLPFTISLVSIGLMFSLILAPGFGAFDQFLKMIGLGVLIRPWLGDYHIALYIMILIDAWAYLGIPLMLFHAGLGGIDNDLYEAARLDGANEWQVAWHVMVPGLRPIMLMVAMLSAINSLKTFDLVSAMTGGGPAGGTTVLGWFMYQVSFRRNDFGYGATVGVVMLLFSAGFALVYLKSIARRALHAE
jgi:multiple sugar transport system permease protein/raffinose/stachyose/melibiose transport system permease protein